MPGKIQIFRNPGGMRDWVRARRAAGHQVGFVPTMGALHAGHLSMVERARRENDRVVASIFVNPLQFGPGEDFRDYPRDLKKDVAILEGARCDAVFVPDAARFYPESFETRVTVPGLSGCMCGRFRPGHFEGVATVVAKLLHVVEPDQLYVGHKDYQQALVIRRMIRDLDLPVGVVICPTVRERDGLAMSSRNRYLDPDQRLLAAGIYQALKEGAARVRAGQKSPARVGEAVRRALQGVGRIQYVEVRTASTLELPRRLSGPTVIAVAVHLGRARLIDNVVVRA